MLVIEYEFPQGLNDLDEKIKLAVVEKLTQLTQIMYDKVQVNLSGPVLQKKTGQLAGSIRQEVNTSGDIMTGTVFPDPASEKAWVLEKGGSSFYHIFPVKGKMLSWIDKGGERIFAKSVFHPPSKEFRYLGIALDEMRELVPEGFEEAIQAVLGNRLS